MKRILSLVLAMVMVLGSFSAVFAAEQTAAEKAGAFLKTEGVLQGNASGDLMLDKDLRREDALVLLSRLMGVEEVAKDFPTADFPFKDVTDKNYEGVIAWAISNELTKGVAADRFGFKQDLKAQDFATFLLRALGYEVTGEAYDVALETAKELGLLADVEVEDKTVVTRGTMAVMTLNALGTPMKDSTETLADKLEIEMPQPEVSTDIEITAAKAVANNKVEVKVKEEVKASVADFVIVKKGDTTELEIKDAVQESAKVFVLETEALVSGTSYTVKSNGKALNFTGVAVDKTAPTAKVTAPDTNRFKVDFAPDVMDKATAENVANYTFNKDLEVVKATLSSDRKSVTLETDAAKKNTTYTLTIENVTNSDGVAMKKASFNVRAIEYTTAPTVKNVIVINNTMVEIEFNAEKGMSKGSLEAVENYVIEGLEVTEAKAYDLDENGRYERVLLTTAEQESNKSYKLTIEGLKDASVLGNTIKKVTRTFRGLVADKAAPVVSGTPKAENGNKVIVKFSDRSAMDIASMTDISNYKITYRKGGERLQLAVLEAEALEEGYPDAYDDANKGVTLTTEEQEEITYEIEINNIADEYGNAMKSAKKTTFRGELADLTPPSIESVKHTGSAIEVKFVEKSGLNKAIVQDPTNYNIVGVGSPTKATMKDNTVTLAITGLTANKQYKLEIENVEDKYGNLMPNRTVNFIALASSADLTPPSLEYIYVANNKEVHLNFDEAVVAPASTVTVKYGASSTMTLTYVGRINDGTTVVYTGSLTDGTEYEFATGTSFNDAAGNKVDIKEQKFKGVGHANDNPVAEYVEQLNVKNVVVTFNEQVKLTANTTVTAKYKNGSTIGIALVKAVGTNDTHAVEWKVTFGSKLAYGKEVILSFGNNIDLASDGSTKDISFTVYDNDEIAPTIVDVVALDNVTVEITYDEEIELPGSYRIKDEKGNYINLTATADDIDGEVLTAKLSTGKLVADASYTLEVRTGATDLSGNREKAVVWGDFLGTNVIGTGDYILGVSIINGKKIKVATNYDITTVVVYEVYGDDQIRPITDTVVVDTDTNQSATATTKVALLDGVDYIVKVDNDKEFKIKGVITNVDVDVDVTTNSANLVFNGLLTDYTVEVLNTSFASAGLVANDGTISSLTYTPGATYYVILTNKITDAVEYAARFVIPTPAP